MLSAGPSGARRAVHPYRDRRDGLIVRRRALEREHAEAERAAERRARIARHIEVIDDELREHRPTLVDAVRIETPCRARWADMRGDDAVRRCDRCHRDVHDLSHMTREEIEALLSRADATPCVRLRRRPDGRVVTADCPVEHPSVARRALRVVTAGVLFGASAGGAAAAVSAPLLGGASSSARGPLEPHDIPARHDVPAPEMPAAVGSEPELEPRPRPEFFGAPSDVYDRADEDEVTMGQPAVDPDGVGVAIAPPLIEEGDLDRHIRWIAPQAWEIDRALLNRGLRESFRLRGPIHFIPFDRDGQTVGAQLYGVHRDSFLGRLGIRNGDRILEMNGTSLGSVEDALWAYERLDRADALFVRLEREHTERVHVYRITD